VTFGGALEACLFVGVKTGASGAGGLALVLISEGDIPIDRSNGICPREAIEEDRGAGGNTAPLSSCGNSWASTYADLPDAEAVGDRDILTPASPRTRCRAEGWRRLGRRWLPPIPGSISVSRRWIS
jgi:hypothetical protein